MKEDNLRRLNIEITSLCNYNCIGCPNKNLERGNEDMDTKLFFKIFKEVGNRVEKVFLWNYGEPLLHQKIPEMIVGIKEYSCKKILSTNGSRLEYFKDLDFLSGLDELIVSINGLDSETYKLHQRGGNFNKLLRGIHKTGQYLKNVQTKYIMQIVVHKGNIGQIGIATDFARNNWFDELRIKSFNVMDNSQETFDQFVPLGTPYSRYIKRNPHTKPIHSGRGRTCLDSMVINWNGEVNPCCWDYSGGYVLGNVNKFGVYTIWESQRAKQFRKSILLKEFPTFCVECAINPYVKR